MSSRVNPLCVPMVQADGVSRTSNFCLDLGSYPPGPFRKIFFPFRAKFSRLTICRSLSGQSFRRIRGRLLENFRFLLGVFFRVVFRFFAFLVSGLCFLDFLDSLVSDSLPSISTSFFLVSGDSEGNGIEMKLVIISEFSSDIEL